MQRKRHDITNPSGGSATDIGNGTRVRESAKVPGQVLIALNYREKLRLARELQEVLEKCDELRTSKQVCGDYKVARTRELISVFQDAIRELLTIQEQHRAELRISGNALQEEINAREAGERRLSELRGEVEIDFSNFNLVRLNFD